MVLLLTVYVDVCSFQVVDAVSNGGSTVSRPSSIVSVLKNQVQGVPLPAGEGRLSSGSSRSQSAGRSRRLGRKQRSTSSWQRTRGNCLPRRAPMRAPRRVHAAQKTTDLNLKKPMVPTSLLCTKEASPTFQPIAQDTANWNLLVLMCPKARWNVDLCQDHQEQAGFHVPKCPGRQTSL